MNERGWPREPSEWIATWFGTGYLSPAPGTWGSLAALPAAWLIHAALGTAGLAVATALVFALGLWATTRTLARSGEQDPQSVVIDEVAGQWLTLLAAPPTILGYGAAFLLFRLFDIAKPWPVRSIDERIPGAYGVMLDDMMAGVYACLSLLLLRLLIAHMGMDG